MTRSFLKYVYTGKGDPLNPAASAKDIQKEREMDTLIADPPCLPVHLSEHDRRTSRVDVDVSRKKSSKNGTFLRVPYQLLFAESPIDSSMFSLYIQQNYTQFCNEIEDCDAVAEALSWADASGGEQVN